MVEPAGLVWRTSVACTTQNCVAVAVTEGRVLVRRTSEPAGCVLEFTTVEWRAFLVGVRAGQFDVDGAGPGP